VFQVALKKYSEGEKQEPDDLFFDRRLLDWAGKLRKIHRGSLRISSASYHPAVSVADPGIGCRLSIQPVKCPAEALGDGSHPPTALTGYRES
jgi:hypothetical protein